ncbi:MAG: thiolase domain-containing protein [Desulfurococcales archaeon]|jgi:acetyl-CoA C-acetyltransferase
MRKIAIVGTGIAKYGYRAEATLAEIAYEAIKEALDEARIGSEDIDSFIVGNVGSWSSEPLPAVLIGEYAGLVPKNGIRVEAACATGLAATRTAYNMIASGEADIVLVIGVEKMNESTTPQVVELIGRAGNYFWEFQNFGMTFPGYYAMYATLYIKRFGVKEEDLCEVAVKNHYYGSMNPKAHFQNRITVEQCMSSRYIAWPLKLYDSSPITDGAAALILASEDVARRITDSPIWIRGWGYANGTSNLSKRRDYIGLEATRVAAEMLYRRIGVDPKNPAEYFDVANLHDAFTIAELMALSDMGFVEKGEEHIVVREKQTYIGGLIPVNLDGGLKAKGHPIGATGVGMVVELTRQLQQRVEKGRQAPIKRGWALAHNVGGTGHYVFTLALSVDKP